MNALKVKRMRIAAPTLATLLMVPVAAQISVAEAPASASPELARLSSLAFRPGAETPTTIRTTPNAVCILHPKGVTDKDHSMNLFADSEGEIRFHVTAHRESEKVEQMQLDCGSADGKFKTFPLELRASKSTVDPLARPEAGLSDLSPSKKGTLRAGLSDAEARSLTDEEIALRQFPPRPDAAKAPKAFANWLRVVSQPATMVPADVVARPDIHHAQGHVTAATGTSSNWSGYELRGIDRTYDVVIGEWYVPSVSSELLVHAYSAYWVGLDGDGTSDLVQAGTEQEYFDFSIFSFSNYYAWSELLPNQPTESEITGIPVSPGQEVYSEVWIGNSNGTLNASGGYGVFYFQNFSTGRATEFVTCLCGTVFLGREAEWIMERPTVGGSLPALADYGAVTMTYAYAETVAGPWTTYAPSSHINITMLNNDQGANDNNTLSTVEPDGNTTMFFLWHNFH